MQRQIALRLGLVGLRLTFVATRSTTKGSCRMSASNARTRATSRRPTRQTIFMSRACHGGGWPSSVHAISALINESAPSAERAGVQMTANLPQ